MAESTRCSAVSEILNAVVTRQRNTLGEIERHELRLARCERFGLLEALAITAAEDVDGQRQLVAFPPVGRAFRKDIDDLDHEVGVGAGRRRHEIDDRRAADAQGLVERVLAGAR